MLRRVRERTRSSSARCTSWRLVLAPVRDRPRAIRSSSRSMFVLFFRPRSPMHNCVYIIHQEVCIRSARIRSRRKAAARGPKVERSGVESGAAAGAPADLLGRWLRRGLEDRLIGELLRDRTQVGTLVAELLD